MWLLPVVLFVTSIGTLHTLEEDSYWRPYKGTIPRDAIQGGKDTSGKGVFIGQTYYHGEGTVVVEIFPGKPEVFAPMGGVSKKIDTHIKILCSKQKNFLWSPVNATHLHLQLINKRPIIGGHEIGGVLYIGRTNHEGGDKIGKIPAFNAGNVRMFYDLNGVEKGVDSYDILLYKQADTDIDVRKDE